MIPYLPPVVLQIGTVSIHGFGIASASSLLLGYYLVRRGARTHGLDPRQASYLFLACVAAGLAVGSTNMLAFWRGQSASGVIAGTAVILIIFLLRRGRESIRYLDVMAFAFPWVWAMARFGCFLAHDHIGARASHWLAVAFPGGSRFDLGALECMAALIAGLLLAVCRSWYATPGMAALTLLAVGLISRTAIYMVAAESPAEAAVGRLQSTTNRLGKRTIGAGTNPHSEPGGTRTASPS